MGEESEIVARIFDCKLDDKTQIQEWTRWKEYNEHIRKGGDLILLINIVQ